MSPTSATTVTVLPMKVFEAPVMSATVLVAPAASHSGADGDGCVLGGVIIGDGCDMASRSVAPQPAPNKTRTMKATVKIAERFFIFVPAGNRPAATRRIHRRAGKRYDNHVESILAPHWRLTPRAVRCSK